MIDHIGRYKILDRLGAGGIGEVYRARDTERGRTVAIKLVGPDIAGDADRRDLFLQDARAAAKVSHPNVASLEEIGDDEGQPYLVFEFALGDTLRALVEGRPINPRRALDYATQIADALADIHAQGLIHQGLTPDNIVITPKGAVKLLDVGLARWTAGGAARAQAARAADTLDSATAKRTAAYMSPEQALGGAFDHRTDVFSLGVILFEMLTGRPAFAVDRPGAISLQVVQTKVASPSSRDGTIPQGCDPIVARMLAKSVDARYGSAATVAAELRAVSSTLDARDERPDAGDAMPPMPGQKSSGLGWVIAVVVLVAIGTLVWMATRVQ